ncbi:MAG: TRAP transporter substrate-binding protein DctP [Geminicoccaceae bacterium]|nr:TRAP transporter substrate-binding protein DctP [Geminicoccaceae bacterium]
MRTMLFGAVAWGAALLAAGPLGAQQFTLKYAHVGPATENSDDHVPGVFLKSFLESRSGGRIKVEIYPAGQLGQFRELFEQIQLNTLELTHTSVGGASAFFPEIQVTDIPYMIRDDLVAETVGRGPFFEKLRDAVLKKTGNVRLVAMGNTGRWRSFFTKKPVLKAADLAGMKIRIVDSPIQVNFVRGAGANPVPIPWGEVYTSLATGVAEGLNIAITDVVPNKLHEVVKHVVIDEHMYLYGFYWMSDAWLKSLPKDLRILVVDGVEQMARVQTDFNKAFESRAYEQFVKEGGTIRVMPPEEKAKLVPGREAAKKWFAEKYGREWLDAWEQALAAAEAQVDAERKRLFQVGG